MRLWAHQLSRQQSSCLIPTTIPLGKSGFWNDMLVITWLTLYSASSKVHLTSVISSVIFSIPVHSQNTSTLPCFLYKKKIIIIRTVYLCICTEILQILFALFGLQIMCCLKKKNPIHLNNNLTWFYYKGSSFYKWVKSKSTDNDIL